jgi:mono/diheme cytochrome c family protein
MGHVIEGLNRLPDQDIRAMAVYFADLSGNAVDPPAREVATLMARNGMPPANATAEEKRGEVIFKNSCAGCHYNPPGLPNVLRPELSLNSAVTGPDPTNLLRLTLEGVGIADGRKDAYMHGYAIGLSDANVVAIARYLRRMYGPANEEADSSWKSMDKSVGTLRALGRGH